MIASGLIGAVVWGILWGTLTQSVAHGLLGFTVFVITYYLLEASFGN